MSLVSVADIVKLGQGAYKLWEYGFSKCKNAEKQYADFGSDILFLHRNIEQLTNVIENVHKQVPSSLSLREQQWDRTALLKICGDFSKTVRECNKLIRENSAFGRGRGGFITNIQWNLTIEPEVRRLKDRVSFHNLKIQAVLKPLEMTLMLDLGDQIRECHGDLASRITNLHGDVLNGQREILLHIQGRWTSNAQEANSHATEAAPELPRVPAYMEYRFDMATKDSYSELADEKSFPFYAGINAFHHHFEQSTVRFVPEQTSSNGFFAERAPEPTQYLNLMKSIWIIQMIKKGDQWVEASKERLVREYIKQLEEKSLREYQRFSITDNPQNCLMEPVSTNISMLRDEEFRIWLDDNDDENDYKIATDYLNEILRVTLASQSRHRKQELVLTRKNDTKLQMQNFSSKTTGPTNREVVRDGINLERAYFVPLYAAPNSLARAKNIVFRGDESSEEDTSLSFLNMNDLLKFQQAITGYKVVLDDADITTHIHKSTSVFGGKWIDETGRVQIWSPRRLEKQTIPLQEQAVNSSQQRLSMTTTSSTAPSASRTTFSTAYTSPVTTRGVTSFNFELPALPILVFYLKLEHSMENDISLLTVQMDPKLTRKARCSCASKKRECIHTAISRSGDLLTQRVSARRGHQVNLAKIGKYRAPREPTFEKGLEKLHIDFDSKTKREKFEQVFEETITIYKRKVACYHAEMAQVKQDDVG